MPSFQNRKNIVLQPYSENVPYGFEFTVCSSAGANDGMLPYGHSVNTCAVEAYDSGGDEVTAQLVGTTSRSANVVTVPLNWPATAGAGKYKLTFKIETNLGMKDEFDFGRVVAKAL